MGIEEEVLEGGLIDAHRLYVNLQSVVRIVAGAEDTLFGQLYATTFMLETLSDALSHLRTCQWHGERS